MRELYKISRDIHDLLSSGMDDELIKDTLDGLEGEFELKLENVIGYMKNEESYAKSLKEESKKLADKAKAIESKNDKLKEYILNSMSALDKKSIRTGLHTVSVRKGVQSVTINDIDKIPTEFIQIKVTEQPDKNLIKEKLKLGEKIEGASLEIGKPSITIK